MKETHDIQFICFYTSTGANNAEKQSKKDPVIVCILNILADIRVALEGICAYVLGSQKLCFLPDCDYKECTTINFHWYSVCTQSRHKAHSKALLSLPSGPSSFST
jgi:hypothetical protein